MSAITAEEIETAALTLPEIFLTIGASIGRPGKGYLGMKPDYVDPQTRGINPEKLAPVCRECSSLCRVAGRFLITTFPLNLYAHDGLGGCLISVDEAMPDSLPPGAG